MKKLLSLLLCSVLVLTVFAGCKGKTDEGSDWEWVDSEVTDTVQVAKEKTGDSGTSTSKNKSGKSYKADSKGTKLQVGGETVVLGSDTNADYSVKGTVTVAVNSYRNSDYSAITKQFQKLFPNVKIKTVVFESKKDDASEYLQAQSVAKKKLPDIIFDDAGNMPLYIENGWMYPLTDFVKNDPDYKSVPASISNRMTFNGNVFALGQTLHSNSVLINKDLVSEMNQKMPSLSWNWSDFETFIRNCTNDKYSGVDDLQQAYNWMPGAMSTNCTIAGYRFATKDFDLLSSCKPAVDFVLKMNGLHSVVASSLKQNSSSGTSDYVKKFGKIDTATGSSFYAGKSACMFSGTWSYASINKRDLPFDWEFYTVPQSSAGRIPTHVDFCWMSTGVTADNVNAAWQYLRFVTYSREGNIARLTTYDEDHYTDSMLNAYYIPCTQDRVVATKFKSLPAVTSSAAYIFDNLEKGYAGDPEKYVPGFEEYVEYSIVLKPVYESMSGQYDFASKMADTQTKANTEIKKYESQFNTALNKFLSEFKPVHK